MLPSDQLFHVQNLFAQGNYSSCISTATPLLADQPTSAEDVTLLSYTLRSHLALPSSAPSAYASLLATASSSEDPTLRAISLLAALTSAAEADDEASKEEVLEQARDLAIELEELDEAGSAKAVAGTVFVKAGEWVEAVDLLSSEAESLECAAILIQIYLSINRLDMARKVYEGAKTHGDDSHLVQQMEAWLGLRSQGPALEQAYYFYDELLQAPASARQPAILAAHGAAHFLLGHVDEAQADVEQAVEAAGGKANDGAVNALGAAAFGAERADEFYSQLVSLSPSHPAVADYAAKAAAFDVAAAKFTPVAASA